jgi:hypothetical protein
MADRVVRYEVHIDMGKNQVWAIDETHGSQIMIYEGREDFIAECLEIHFPKHCRILGGKIFR